MERVKKNNNDYVTHRDSRWHTFLCIGTLLMAVALLYGDAQMKDDFVNAGKRFTYCDGQALASSIWRTPIEDECIDTETDFQKYIQEAMRPETEE